MTVESLFDIHEDEFELESKETISPRKLVRQKRAKLKKAMKREELAQWLKEAPKPGETFHCVTNGKWDYWDLVPHLINLDGREGFEFYASTWTLNRSNCLELLELLAEEKISTVSFLTGIYFKRRESSVYATLVEGLRRYKQRYLALETHAKVALIGLDPNFFVIEGSANFTANPRIEQNIIANSKELYDFHKEWIDEIFKNGKRT